MDGSLILKHIINSVNTVKSPCHLQLRDVITLVTSKNKLHVHTCIYVCLFIVSLTKIFTDNSNTQLHFVFLKKIYALLASTHRGFTTRILAFSRY